jgi:hypothetical protein
MKNQSYLYTLIALLCLTTLPSHAQAPNRFAFGIKGGLNHMNTQLIREPSNFAIYLEGVRSANGHQAGLWGTFPLGRWLFVDADLGYLQKGHRQTILGANPIVANNNYRYLNASSRLGFMYKGAFVSVGPEANVLLSREVTPWKEAQAAEWAVNARVGYQYRRIRAELFYSKSINEYEQKIWNAEKQYKTLFYGKTIGVSVGIKLFEGKARKR